MPENQVKFEFTGDSAQLDETQDNLARGADELAKKYRDTAKAGQEAATAAKRLVAQLERTQSTPVERLARAEALLNTAVERGLISRSRANELLERQRASAQSVETTLTATGNAGESAFSRIGSALGAVGIDLSPAGLIQTGLSAARALMGEFREETDGAVRSLRELEDPDKRLLQVSTSPEDLDALQATSDRIAPLIGDRRQARELVFAARSQGFEGDIDTIAAARNVAEIPSLIELASASKKFADTSVEQSLNLGLVAAGGSKFNLEQLTGQLFKAAEGAQQAKAGAPETFAATAVLAKKFEQSTGDRLKVFLAKAAQTDELRGKGLIGAFDALERLPPEKRQEFLGESVDLNAVVSVLRETIDPIRALTAQLETAKAEAGQPTSALAQRIEIGARDTEIRARQQLRESEVTREIASESRFGVPAADAEARRNRIFTAALDNEASGFSIALGRVFDTALRIAPDRVREAGVVGAISIGDSLSTRRGETQEDIRGRTERLERSLVFAAEGITAQEEVQRRTERRERSVGPANAGVTGPAEGGRQNVVDDRAANDMRGAAREMHAAAANLRKATAQDPQERRQLQVSGADR